MAAGLPVPFLRIPEQWVTVNPLPAFKLSFQNWSIYIGSSSIKSLEVPTALFSLSRPTENIMVKYFRDLIAGRYEKFKMGFRRTV
jgi:hypothetical protein